MLCPRALLFPLALSLGLLSSVIVCQDGPAQVVGDLVTLTSDTHDLVIQAENLKAGGCYGFSDVREGIESLTTKLADDKDELNPSPPAASQDVVLAFRFFASETITLASTLAQKAGTAKCTVLGIAYGDRKGLQVALPKYVAALETYDDAIIGKFDDPDFVFEMEYLEGIIKQQVELMLSVY